MHQMGVAGHDLEQKNIDAGLGMMLEHQGGIDIHQCASSDMLTFIGDRLFAVFKVGFFGLVDCFAAIKSFPASGLSIDSISLWPIEHTSNFTDTEPMSIPRDLLCASMRINQHLSYMECK